MARTVIKSVYMKKPTDIPPPFSGQKKSTSYIQFQNFEHSFFVCFTSTRYFPFTFGSSLLRITQAKSIKAPSSSTMVPFSASLLTSLVNQKRKLQRTDSPLSGARNPSRTKLGSALVPAGRSKALADLRSGGAAVLVMNGDAVVASDLRKAD